MQEDKLYDTLLNLPLFLGMSRADLLQIAGHTKFDFQKIEGGETLTEIGEPYHRLLFLLSGEVAVETMADDRGYRIVETIKAPEVFMIERLFGYDQHSPHHYVARNDCSLMSISKKEVLRLAKQYEIFHINLLKGAHFVVYLRTHVDQREGCCRAAALTETHTCVKCRIQAKF